MRATELQSRAPRPMKRHFTRGPTQRRRALRIISFDDRDEADLGKGAVTAAKDTVVQKKKHIVAIAQKRQGATSEGGSLRDFGVKSPGEMLSQG